MVERCMFVTFEVFSFACSLQLNINRILKEDAYEIYRHYYTVPYK